MSNCESDIHSIPSESTIAGGCRVPERLNVVDYEQANIHAALIASMSESAITCQCERGRRCGSMHLYIEQNRGYDDMTEIS